VTGRCGPSYIAWLLGEVRIVRFRAGDAARLRADERVAQSVREIARFVVDG